MERINSITIGFCSMDMENNDDMLHFLLGNQLKNQGKVTIINFKGKKDIYSYLANNNPQLDYVMIEKNHELLNHIQSPAGRKKLRFHLKGKDIFVNEDDIVYIERMRRTTILHLKEGQIIISEKLDELGERLAEYFIRCHTSFIINMHYVKTIYRNLIELENDITVSISRKYSCQFQKVNNPARMGRSG